MPEYFYTTIEDQKRTNGSYGTLWEHFYEIDGQLPALARAQAKYHTICAAAAISEIPYHSAYLIRSDGYIVEQSIWDRREEPQPNPEPEE